MRSFVLCGLIFFSALACPSAGAAIVRYDFVGTVTSSFDNDPATSPNQIFGTPVTVGDSVFGFFFLDLTALQTDSLTGLSGDAVQYDQNVPQGMSVTVNGLDFRSLGTFSATMGNDFTDSVTLPPVDAFGVSDGISTGFTDLSGTTILAGGIERDGRLGLQFLDFNAVAFNSIDLPSSLNLSNFQSIQGTLNGTEPFSGGGAPYFYEVDFSIDSLTVTAVPEPSSIMLIAGLCMGLVVRRCRSLNTKCD